MRRRAADARKERSGAEHHTDDVTGGGRPCRSRDPESKGAEVSAELRSATPLKRPSAVCDFLAAAEEKRVAITCRNVSDLGHEAPQRRHVRLVRGEMLGAKRHQIIQRHRTHVEAHGFAIEGNHTPDRRRRVRQQESLQVSNSTGLSGCGVNRDVPSNPDAASEYSTSSRLPTR